MLRRVAACALATAAVGFAPPAALPARAVRGGRASAAPAFRPSVTRASAAAADAGGEPIPSYQDVQAASGKLLTRKLEIAALQRELATKEKSYASERALFKRMSRISGVGTVRETAKRSAVKALVWRLVAGLITFTTSFIFTGGDTSAAAKIVGADFLTKAGTMFVGERAFNKMKAGRSSKGGDSAGRSLTKALVWRCIAIVQSIAVGSVVTSSAKTASKIASTDAVIKTSLMVLYERFWNFSDWEREYDAAANTGGGGI